MAEYREALRPYVGDTFDYLYHAVREGKNVLLEGQLGALKDTDFGIYPMVYLVQHDCRLWFGRSRCAAYSIQEIVTVVKAYSSAVGAGEFVSEFSEKKPTSCAAAVATAVNMELHWASQKNGLAGFGSNRYGCRVQGTTSIAFTVLDVLGYLDEIPVCVAYELDGQQIDNFPSTTKLKRAKPSW